jgi:hypothetical protein
MIDLTHCDVSISRPAERESWYQRLLNRGWEMDETFQARWRSAVVGLCLTAAVFAAGWLIAFS